MSTHTMTALFGEHTTAERATERLRAIGIPEDALELHQAAEGDVLPGNAAGGGLFGLRDPLVALPESLGMESNRTVVVASRIPDGLRSEARSILREDAIEVDDQRDSG